MEITVLIENTGCPALAREHGLAVHIAYRGHSILLDTGSSGAFGGLTGGYGQILCAPPHIAPITLLPNAFVIGIM